MFIEGRGGIRLAAGLIIIADSFNPTTDVPALTTSLRGLVDCIVELRMLARPAHSGMFGGPLGDALTALCRLLDTLHNDKGRVAVAGLVHHSSDAPDVDEATFRSDAAVFDGVELVTYGVRKVGQISNPDA